MRRYILALMMLTLCAGCGRPETETAPTAANTSSDEAVATAVMTGKEAYDAVCARCHDDGVDGAPRIGDREAWADRSQLWEAVLFEHARDGYLSMPARGGEESFDDATVEKAAEYMLKQTFPDRIHAD